MDYYLTYYMSMSMYMQVHMLTPAPPPGVVHWGVGCIKHKCSNNCAIPNPKSHEHSNAQKSQTKSGIYGQGGGRFLKTLVVLETLLGILSIPVFCDVLCWKCRNG